MGLLSRVLVLTLVGALVGACQGERAATHAPPAHSAPRAHSAPLAETAHANAPAPDVPAGVGRACVTPKDCPSFLWCVDETCTIPAAVSATPGENTPRIEFLGADGSPAAAFWLELALTSAEHEKGLMFRRSLPDDWGMLFVYPDEAQRSFWMQNTFIALDMVFLTADGTVDSIIAQAEPLTRTPRTSDGAARYVLEIRGGRAAELGLKPGDRVRLEHVSAAHQLRPR